MAKPEEPIQIGALSERTRVTIETIRYYERIGLIARAPRTSGGYRRYGIEDVLRLSFIRRLRELGFGLDDIRAMLDLAETKRTSCNAVRGLASRHLGGVQDKMKDLRRMERVLKEMIASCDRGVAPECPIIEALWRTVS